MSQHPCLRLLFTMCEESIDYLPQHESIIDETLVDHDVQLNSPYYQLCYYITYMYADYRLLGMKLREKGCQIDYNISGLYTDPDNIESEISPIAYIDTSYSTKVYAHINHINELKDLCKWFNGADRVMRLCLSVQQWSDTPIKHYVYELVSEWLWYREDNATPLSITNDHINLTRFILDLEDSTTSTEPILVD